MSGTGASRTCRRTLLASLSVELRRSKLRGGAFRFGLGKLPGNFLSGSALLCGCPRPPPLATALCLSYRRPWCLHASSLNPSKVPIRPPCQTSDVYVYVYVSSRLKCGKVVRPELRLRRRPLHGKNRNNKSPPHVLAESFHMRPAGWLDQFCRKTKRCLDLYHKNWSSNGIASHGGEGQESRAYHLDLSYVTGALIGRVYIIIEIELNNVWMCRCSMLQ